MKVGELRNKKILILGLGREGLATLKYLNRHLPNQKFSVADVQQKQLDNLNIFETFFKEDYLKHLTEFDMVIKTAGISPNLPEIKDAKEKGVIFTSATAIFFSEFPGQIIGITGTKGKSTTASLVYEVLKIGGIKTELIGNIGKPCLDYLDSLNEDTIVVYELSSYNLDSLTKSPHIAVITNIYQEHLDWHGDFDSYLKAKLNITNFQTEDDFLIFNDQNQIISDAIKNSNARKIAYSSIKLEQILDPKQIKKLGKINQVDAVPAVVIGQQIFKIPDKKIKQALMEFKPLEHRLEFVAEKNGVKFYNDSLATIPEATIAALENIGEDIQTLIAGGFDRGIDYSILGSAIKNSKIKNLILFPTTGEKIWQAVVNTDSQNLPEKFEVDSMEQAVKLAFEKTEKGKIVLLSPASSSFNIFKDYADRGNQFKEAILKY